MKVVSRILAKGLFMYDGLRFEVRNDGSPQRIPRISAFGYGQSVTTRILRLVALMVVCASGANAQSASWPALDSLDEQFTRLDSLSTLFHGKLSVDSLSLEAWEGLCRLAKQRGLHELQMTLAQCAARLLPTEPRSHTLLGDAYLDNGYLPEAIESLHRALYHDPGGVRTLTMLAEAFDLVDLSDSVLLYIDSAIALNPRNVQAQFQRADHLYRHGRKLEAIESYEAWALLQPFKPEPWIRLGEAQITVGLYARAHETLSYAVELAPESPEARFLLAMSLKRTGKLEEAKRAFVDFLFSFPTHVRAFEAEELARELGWSPTGR